MSVTSDLSRDQIQPQARRPLPARPAGEPRLALQWIAAEAFDRIASEFDGSCQEQLIAYAQMRWPNTKIEPVLFTLDGEVVGGTPVMIQPIPLKLGAIAVVKWGPMLKDAKRPDAGAIYAAMIDALVAEYADKRRLMLSVMPRASVTPVNRELETLYGKGFKEGSKLLFPNRYIVNLRLSDQELRKSFGQKWRYHLNKADKAGLSFEHADRSRLPEFSALYQAMSDRKDFADHAAYDTVPAMMATSAEKARPELFFVRFEGEVVAGAVIYPAGDTAVYLYGATNDKALPLRAGYFLHWHVIRWLRDNTRADWYDLGGTDGFQGLHQFKKGMVGDKGVIEPVPPVTYYASFKPALWIGEAIFAARDGMTAVRRKLEARRHKAKPDQARTEAE